MFERLGFDEKIAKIVCHHPLGTIFCGIDTHDGEPFATNLLNTVSDHTIRLLQIHSAAGI